MSRPLAVAVWVLFFSGCVAGEDAPEGAEPAPLARPTLVLDGCQAVFTAFLVDMEWAQQQVPEGHRPQPAAASHDLAALDQYLMECDDIRANGNSTGSGAIAFSYIALAPSMPARGVSYAHDIVADASSEVVRALKPFSDRLSSGQVSMVATPATIEVAVESPNSSYTLRLAPRADTFVHFPLNSTIIMDHGRFWAEHGDERQNHLQAASLYIEHGRLEGAAATDEVLAGSGQEWRSYYRMTSQTTDSSA